MPKVRKGKSNDGPTVALILILGLLFGGIVLFLSLPVKIEFVPYFQPDKNFASVDVVRVVQDNVLVIGKGCTAIVAPTSPERAAAIEDALNNKIDVRPTAYDGFASVLQSFDLKLEAVVMTKFDNDVYFSNAIVREGNKVLEVDMRPSDSIALALRVKSPIYMNSTMLQQQGRNIC